MDTKIALTPSLPYRAPFPSTRYQGSKRQLVEWIWATTCDLAFDSVLDVFGGTGAVSHLFKCAGKQVSYNDYLAFNWNIGLALIQNADTRLSPDDLALVLEPQPDTIYPDFIQRTFANIYFTDAENGWLDRVVYNIDHFLDNSYKKALARFALFQACIIKRPYNLFHRANLYMRQAAVSRTFGNKAAWDAPFETHFRAFAAEANRAIFDNGRDNRALHLDALATLPGTDLVYLDPPYLNRDGIGVDYYDFYHFLEGMTDYDTWPSHVDYQSKHRRLVPQKSAWSQSQTILGAFEQVIALHRDSILVVSYRDDGIPTKVDLLELLRSYKRDVREAVQPQKYVLAGRASHELLFVAW